MVKYLVEKHRCDPKSKDTGGDTPLNVAAFSGSLDTLIYLIEERKCSPQCPGKWGRSPLHNACEKNWNLAMVKYLVEKHGCDPKSKDTDGDTPLNVAAFSGSLEILIYLIEERKCSPQCPGKWGRSPLHNACEKNWNLAMVKYLVEKHGCDPAGKDLQGNTPLNVAAFSGSLDILMYLIEERKCSPRCPGQWGRSPLHDACGKNWNLAMVKYLVEKHGCDPTWKDDDGDTSFNVAALSGSLDILIYLIEERKYSPRCPGKWGRLPLHDACEKNGNLAMVKYLVEKHGCDPTWKDDDGDTSLNVAALSGSLDILIYLIEERKYSPRCPGQWGRSPLHNACDKNVNLAMVKYLVEKHGCDPAVKDEQGNTPLNVAAWSGSLNILMYLKERKCSLQCPGKWGRSPLNNAYGQNGNLAKYGCDPAGKDLQRNSTHQLYLKDGFVSAHFMRFLIIGSSDVRQSTPVMKRPVQVIYTTLNSSSSLKSVTDQELYELLASTVKKAAGQCGVVGSPTPLHVSVTTPDPLSLRALYSQRDVQQPSSQGSKYSYSKDPSSVPGVDAQMKPLQNSCSDDPYMLSNIMKRKQHSHDNGGISSLSEVEEQLMPYIAKTEDNAPLGDIDWVYFIDSGGQPQFHQLLPAFMHHTNLNIFVLRLCDKLSDHPTVEYYDERGTCTSSTASLMTNKEILQCCTADQDGDSRLLIVGTHRDQEEKCKETREEKNEQLLELLTPTMKDHMMPFSADELIFPVNTEDPSKVDREVTSGFLQAISSMKGSMISMDISLQWQALLNIHVIIKKCIVYAVQANNSLIIRSHEKGIISVKLLDLLKQDFPHVYKPSMFEAHDLIALLLHLGIVSKCNKDYFMPSLLKGLDTRGIEASLSQHPDSVEPCAMYYENRWLECGAFGLITSLLGVTSKEIQTMCVHMWMLVSAGINLLCLYYNYINLLLCYMKTHYQFPTSVAAKDAQPSCPVPVKSWSVVPLLCTVAHTAGSVLLNGLHPATYITLNIAAGESLTRGLKKLSKKQSSEKMEDSCEEASPLVHSGEMVCIATNCAVKEFRGVHACVVTGRQAKSGPPVQDSQLRRMPAIIPSNQFAPQVCKNTVVSKTPSTSVTADINLCDGSKAVYSSVVEFLGSEQHSQIIQLLEPSSHHHSCTTKHCQAVLFNYFGLGLANYKLVRYTPAMEYFTEYKRLAQVSSRPADVCLAHVYIGDISAAKSDYSSAAHHYYEAIMAYGENGANNACSIFKLVMPSKSSLYVKQGTALRQVSQMVRAVEALRNAITSALDGKSELSAHNSLGNTLQSMGDYSGALEEYTQSIKLGEELKDLVSLGWSHGNMGNAYLGLQQKDKALYHLKKSLELTVTHECTPQAISRAYNNLGTAYQNLDNLQLAKENFQLALNQAIYGNDTAGQARARGNLGNLLMLEKQYKEAIEHYSGVLNLSKERQVLSTVYHNRGCAYYEWAEQLKSKPDGESTVSQPDVGTSCTDAMEQPADGKINSQHRSEVTSYINSANGNDRQKKPQSRELKSEVTTHSKVTELYRSGVGDLTEVVKYCNEVFESTKGSKQGLTLSVSLIESNSRTFHKMQDCLVGLLQTDEALVIAEQCRARTLGEILLEKVGGGVAGIRMAPPLTLYQIKHIVELQACPVVYFSYTGSRLIIWLMVTLYGNVSIHHKVVEVEKFEKVKFDGKTFDQYVRQSLQEAIVGSDLELFHDVSSAQTSPITVLYEVVVPPILDMLSNCGMKNVKSMVLIPDSYTSLIPFIALHPEGDYDNTFGSTFSIQIMPSLLVMGILNGAHHTTPVTYDDETTCVVGNPHIPTFKHNEEEWNLGRLPHATEEAKWISQLLGASPLLHEQATKDAVLNKVTSAQVIHIATHGSAVSSFLAFAGPDAFNGEPSKSDDVLLLPSEVEKLTIRAAMVVLSSCDSGRGMVRADGIIGMGRAFLLAGAQSVLTTLWRIPDESAGMFMQFFYQYLVDGLGTTHALQKATLSVRCFKKYSSYSHWGGFQLIGREMFLSRKMTAEDTLLTASLGPANVFPQVSIVEKLEQALIQNATFPSNVQVMLDVM